ncbi:MAG: hypothetical protein H0W44_05335 [Gammaproteobacteria bacterium]|nr:hypothetical protein [Gammaproteobacteria bacterium]
MSVERLASALRKAYQKREAFEITPEHIPASLEEAYAVADALVEDAVVIGWKVGATTIEGQKFLNIKAPFSGRIFARTLYHSPAVWPLRHEPISVEPEIGFLLGQDLVDLGQPYDVHTILPAIKAVVPMLEVNWSCYIDPFKFGGLPLVAANGVNVGVIVGPSVFDWGPETAKQAKVFVSCNNNVVEQGQGSIVLGDPLNALVWLANHGVQNGQILRAGQYIAPGALTRLVHVQLGDQITADFGALGKVSVTISSAP